MAIKRTEGAGVWGWAGVQVRARQYTVEDTDRRTMTTEQSEIKEGGIRDEGSTNSETSISKPMTPHPQPRGDTNSGIVHPSIYSSIPTRRGREREKKHEHERGHGHGHGAWYQSTAL